MSPRSDPRRSSPIDAGRRRFLVHTLPALCAMGALPWLACDAEPPRDPELARRELASALLDLANGVRPPARERHWPDALDATRDFQAQLDGTSLTALARDQDALRAHLEATMADDWLQGRTALLHGFRVSRVEMAVASLCDFAERS